MKNNIYIFSLSLLFSMGLYLVPVNNAGAEESHRDSEEKRIYVAEVGIIRGNDHKNLGERRHDYRNERREVKHDSRNKRREVKKDYRNERQEVKHDSRNERKEMKKDYRNERRKR
ncbi:MAG: hypothetical protein GQ583_12690 [Methyloprofundus sp.]|nr:hypothetical protein [Methyloprofundus sp.]